MMGEAEKSNFDLFVERYAEMSESQEFKYNDSDWTVLAERMDRESSNQRVIPIIMVIGILCTFLLSWNLAPSATIAGSQNTSVIFDETRGTYAEDRAKLTLDPNSSLSEEPTFTKKQAIPLPKSNASLEAIVSQEVITKTEIESGNKDNRQDQNRADALVEKGSKENPSQLSASEGSKREEVFIPQDTEVTDAAANKNKNDSEIENEKRLPIEGLAKISSLVYDSEEFTQPERMKFPEPMAIDVFVDSKLPRFVFGLNGGVEISQTSTGDISDTDYSVGAKFGIVASKNFVLNVGLNYIRECYITPTSDYTVPMGYWKGNIPDDIQAICDMLDFSIGASYYFNDILNDGLVAHVNFSSNRMIHETYEYRLSDGSSWIDEFSFSNSTLLSNIELSTTYNFMLADKFSVDLGPYIKIPVNGIGFGEVKLRSYGFRLGMNVFR